LVYEDGSYDPVGAAAHARLGYEQMYQHIGGYRIALGLQYGFTDEATFFSCFVSRSLNLKGRVWRESDRLRVG
jgi:hypothetical protein